MFLDLRTAVSAVFGTTDTGTVLHNHSEQVGGRFHTRGTHFLPDVRRLELHTVHSHGQDLGRGGATDKGNAGGTGNII